MARKGKINFDSIVGGLVTAGLIDSTLGNILSSILYGGKAQYELANLTAKQQRAISQLQKTIASQGVHLANQEGIASRIANFVAAMNPVGRAYEVNQKAYNIANKEITKLREAQAKAEAEYQSVQGEFIDKVRSAEKRARDEQIMSSSLIGGLIHEAKKLIGG